MLRLMSFALIASLLGSCKKGTAQTKNKLVETGKKQSIHQFVVEDLYGENFNFSTLKGKKILVVNTASKCGLTPQYSELQKLYETYKDQNFTIVGFPANNFLFQEPGSDKDIASFCQKNYGVTFPMMSKVSVKGKNQAKIYQFLTKKELNGTTNSSVKWNFQKFLIDENGYVVKSISPKTSPLDANIVDWITK